MLGESKMRGDTMGRTREGRERMGVIRDMGGIEHWERARNLRDGNHNHSSHQATNKKPRR